VAPSSGGRLRLGSASSDKPVARNVMVRLSGCPTRTGCCASGQPSIVRLNARAGNHALLPQSAGAACTSIATGAALAETLLVAPKKLPGSYGSTALPWKLAAGISSRPACCGISA